MTSTENEEFYRNNTVDLDPGEIKDTPRSDFTQQSYDDATQDHPHQDSPVIIDHRRRPAHSSPTEPTINETANEESMNPSYQGNTSGENAQKDISKHTLPNQQQTDKLYEHDNHGHGLSSPSLSPRQRDLVYQSSMNKDHERQSTKKDYPTEGTGRQNVVYLMRSRSPQKSGKSAESAGTVGNSKRSTVEDELKSLSTTPRYSHEDLGRIVSPPDSESDYTRTDINTLSNVDDDMKSILQDANTVKRDIQGQENKRHKTKDLITLDEATKRFHLVWLQDQLDELKESLREMYSVMAMLRIKLDLQNRLWDVEEEVKDLNVKLATLRVKLGVANANTNVSKTDCEELRKKYQETQIQMARLEERSKSSTAELERLKDPENPDSNVNMKKIVVNDRKEIRRLRNELEGIRSERSEARKQMDEQDERIASLREAINNIQVEVNHCKEEYQEANARSEQMEKDREDMETKCNDLLREKEEFESQYSKLNHQLESTISGTSSIHKVSEQYKNREQTLMSRIASTDKKLRDVLTEIEQQKNRNMPQRTASSIKYHQYRMSKTSGVVTDTTPQVIVTSNPKGSIGSSGFLGKTVVSQKLTTSLPSRNTSNKAVTKGKAGSLPAKK